MSGNGLTFFTKLLLDKAYADAHVIYLDTSNSFGGLSETYSLWPRQVQHYSVGSNITGIRRPATARPDWDTQTELNPAILQGRLHVITMPLNHEWTSPSDKQLFTQELLRQFVEMPYRSGPPAVLILDNCWQQQLMANQAGSEYLRFLLACGSKYNKEVWLIDQGEVTHPAYYEKSGTMAIVKKAITNVQKICILGYPTGHQAKLFELLYGLDQDEMASIKSLNQYRCANEKVLARYGPAKLPYRNVFIQGGCTSGVYGVVATEQEGHIYGDKLGTR